jgi:hypothetical protein
MERECPNYFLEKDQLSPAIHSNGIEYAVWVEDRDFAGSAQLVIMRVDDCFLGNFGSFAYDGFNKLGFNDDDLVGEISEFFPNGSLRFAMEHDYLEKGVGSAVYCDVVADAKGFCAKGLYGHTDVDEMISFLNGKNFTEVGDKKGDYMDFVKRI